MPSPEHAQISTSAALIMVAGRLWPVSPASAAEAKRASPKPSACHTSHRHRMQGFHFDRYRLIEPTHTTPRQGDALASKFDAVLRPHTKHQSIPHAQP
jgi:hypothetical protein